jgi:PAS domain S-box-containing protein
MNLFTRLPIRLTIPLFLFLLILLADGFTMMYSQNLAAVEEEQKAFGLVRLDMSQLQENVSYRLRKGDWEGVQSAIANSGANPNVTVGILVDDKGTLIDSTNLKLVGLTISRALPDVNAAWLEEVRTTLTGRVFLSNDRLSISAYYPVILGARGGEIRPHRVGVLYLRYDLAYAKASRRYELERRMFVLTGFYAGCFLLLGLFLHLFITKRVSHLVSAARRLAAGDLSARASLGGEDELAQIGRDFDRMAGEIARSQKVLRRLNRELSAIRSCNQAMMRAEDEQTLLDAVCHIVCDEAGYRAAWVGFAENDAAKSIRPVAWAGLDTGYLEQAGLTWADTEQGHGSSGTVIRDGESVCVLDVATAPEFAPWRDSAYRSGIALPLKDESANRFGVLNIYSSEPDAFTSDEIRLLEELAGDLAYGILSLRARIERKRAEEALRESEVKYRRIVDTATEGIWLLDPDTKTAFINARMAEMLGYPAEEMKGRPLTDFMFAEDVPDYQRRMAARRQGITENYERRFCRHDGQIIWTIASTTPIFDEEHQFKGFMAMFTDITKRKKAEDDLKRLNETLEQKVLERTAQLEKANASLKQADRLKDEFLSAISHELRSPLNAITGFGSILEDEVLGPLNEQQHESLSKLLKSSDRMLSLINDLLDFAKIRAGRFEISPREMDYGPLVDEVVAGMGPLAQEKRLSLDAAIEVPLKVSVDPQRIVQVLTNLVSNSLKFTPPGGRILIKAFVEDNQLVTEVRDTGIGIESADLPQLFTPFKQLEAGLAQKAGTGLGLSICKGIVEAHGGKISAESPGLGKGSVFRFTLPLN